MRGWFVACLMVVGCKGGGTELIVDVRTDYVPGIEFSEVEVVRLGDDGDTVFSRIAEQGDDYVRGLRIVELDVNNSRVELRARLLAADGRRIADRRQLVEVRGTTGVTIVITRDCEGIACPDEQECLDGQCVEPGCSPERPELCGTLVLCGRDEACTQPNAMCARAVCEGSLCFDQEIEGACAANEYCVPEEGCVARPDEMTDAGPMPDSTVSPDAGGCGDPCVVGCRAGVLDCGTGECVGNDPADAGTLCRATTGECDIEEMCDGVSTTCPDDSFVMTGTACAEGFCDGSGNCASGCTPGMACPRANPCERGVIDCSSGTPECIADGPNDAGIECRASAGECDVAELCDGVSTMCPDDAFDVGATCRAAAGECDVAETCIAAPACPDDDFVMAGASCSAGFCDGLGDCSSGCTPGAPCSTGNACEMGEVACAPFRCVGVGPVDAGTVCRAAMGECDVAEQCDGSSVTCPTDGFDSSTECRASMGVCDVAETCNGASPNCPTNGFRPPSFECRASAGDCDVAETCTGSSTTCPTNAFLNGTTCRAAAGTCDIAETCNGTDADCPDNELQDAGFVCRAVNGVCDVAEICNGSSATCPTDQFATSGVCRSGSGTCNPSESCDGSGPDCPDDRFTSSGTPCFGPNECADYECNGSGSCQFAGGGCPPSAPICCERGICINAMSGCP